MAHVELGDRVRDPITKFEGIAICRAEWLHGCMRIVVQKEGELDKENKPIEVSFDEPALEVVESGALKPKLVNAPHPPGGPDRHEDRMTRRGDVSRR